MTSIYGMSNTEIDKAICKAYKSEKARAILRDKCLNGMTYEEILKKYWLDWWEVSETTKRRRMSKIRRMAYRVQRLAEQEEQHG